MTLPTELDVLRDVVERLESNGLAYMLTGALATSYYAEPRTTRDIDLVVALSPSDADGIAALFKRNYHVPAELRDAITNDGCFNLIHLESITRVDIVVRRDTPFHLREFERRRQVGVAGFDFWIVSKEDLMLAKLDVLKDSRSEVQLRDIRNLAATDFDRAYVEEWVREMGLEQVWQEVTG